MASRTLPTLALSLLVSLLVFGTACSDESDISPSGGALLRSSESAGRGGNQPPVIHSADFDPSHVVPGGPVEVHVEAVDPDGDPITLEYRWTIRAKVYEAAGRRLDVPAWATRDDRVAVEIVAKDGQEASDVFSLETRVANGRPTLLEIRIQTEEDANGTLGNWVARPLAEDPDGDRLSFRYEWIVNGQASGADRARFERSQSHRGDEIRLKAWASDGTSESSPLLSAPFRVGNSPPEIVSRPPTLDESGLFLYAVQVEDRDGDTDFAFSLEEAPSGMKIDPGSGQLQWTPTLADSGEHAVTVAVDDRHGGSSRQGFYVQVETSLPTILFDEGRP